MKPVARVDFTAYPWDPFSEVSYLVANEGLTPPPNPKDFTVESADLFNKSIKVDSKFYDAFGVWQSKLKVAFEQHKAKIGRLPMSFKTDLTGAASLDLEPGEYFFVGSYRDSFTAVAWDVRADVNGGSRLIEVSNDNAKNIANQESAEIQEAGVAGMYENVRANGGYYLPVPNLTDRTEATELGGVACGVGAGLGLLGALAVLIVSTASAKASR